MDHQNHDKVFFVNFSMVMAGLFAIFFICILAASLLDTGEIHADPDADARIEARIKPVGAVITDEAALLQLAAAAPKREPLTGEQVNAKLCAGCHLAGVLGAPKSSDKGAWAARLSAAGGVDGLVASSIKGKGSMPAKGGDPSLSDDEIRAAVEQILKAAGV